MNPQKIFGSLRPVFPARPLRVDDRVGRCKEAVPRAQRIALLWNPANRAASPIVLTVEDAARSLGVELRVAGARAPEEFEPTFRAMTRARADALLVVPDSVFAAHRARLADLSSRHRLPTMYG